MVSISFDTMHYFCRIDTALYQDCQHDAQEICQATKWGDDKESNMPDNFVISCLYRNSLIPEGNKKVSFSFTIDHKM